MPGERYQLIFLGDIAQTQRYTSPRKGGSEPRIPARDRVAHSTYLNEQLNQAWQVADQRREEAVLVRERQGAYIEFESEPGFDLWLKSLENLRPRDKIRLLNEREVIVDQVVQKRATVYVPFSQRRYFLDKINDYAERETANNKPKNANLINSISSIRSAVVESFWNKREENQIPDENFAWVEIWLRNEDGAANERFEALAASLRFELVHESLSFPERVIRLVYANFAVLESIVTHSDDIAEMHAAKELCTFFLDMNNQDQAAFAQELLGRTDVDEESQVAVCILDSGVNRGHILIAPMLDPSDLHAVDPLWRTDDHSGHGTKMAGVALYGDINELLQTNDRNRIDHRIESSKILPPNNGANPRHLWGYITAQGISRAEIQAPDRKRVICLAVTALNYDVGKPTSWSAEIDRVASGAEDETKRLIIVSAGNVSDPAYWSDYYRANLLSGVEDPGQSWNALTVGAYTEKVRINDPRMVNFASIAPFGGLSPFSTTSVSWVRTKWPNKPDVVFEGGNVATDGNLPMSHEDLELLTTNHLPLEAQFTTINATSAATALASKMAAQIRYLYPEAWEETVRGLIVHSAEWNEALRQQFLPAAPSKSDYANLLRICGYGVPNLERAVHCASNSLTLVSQADMQPYNKIRRTVNNKVQTAYVTWDMHLYNLPWPRQILANLGNQIVSLRLTLSYFVEPAPGEIGWNDRYRYPSHALRFNLNGPAETQDDFIRRINALARAEDEGLPISVGPSDKWQVGELARSLGSIHSDIWNGTAIELASSNLIAVYPTVGWWRSRPHLQKWGKRCRYSLIASIVTPEIEQDIYIEVANQIAVPVAVPLNR